jgi:hypothetical protein
MALDLTRFRWRNDDGTEVTASWAAAEGAAISPPSGVTRRLRAQVQAGGVVGARQYQLEYRKTGETVWKRVAAFGVGIDMAVANAQHAMASPVVLLGQVHGLTVSGAGHAVLSDNLTLVGGGNTINAASASQADVQSAINAAPVGWTVQVPAGSGTWSSLSINKAITLKGAGGSATQITLGAGNVVTKQTTGITRISDLQFSKSGGGNNSYAWTLSGPWPSGQPIVFERNIFNISGSACFAITTPGGIVIAQNAFTGGWDDSFIKPKADSDTASWSTNRTWGDQDTTGQYNTYVEGNSFYGGTNQGIDADDASRVVYRYNQLTYSSFNSHGWATSPIGVRHFEVYNNDFRYPAFSGSPGGTDVTNQNWMIWIRGGAGVIHNNTLASMNSSWWGAKNGGRMTFSIRGAEDNRPQGSCANVSYPVPHQIGQGWTNGAYSTDKIWIYSNTISGSPFMSAGWNWGNPCGLNFNDFWQSGRDYELNNGAPPGYAPYQYPHPARTSSGTAY